MKITYDTDNAEDLVKLHKLQDADRILREAKTIRDESRRLSWSALRRDEMFHRLVHHGFAHGLSTMENGEMPAGQDMDGWRRQVVEAARFIANCAYPEEPKP